MAERQGRRTSTIAEVLREYLDEEDLARSQDILDEWTANDRPLEADPLELLSSCGAITQERAAQIRQILDRVDRAEEGAQLIDGRYALGEQLGHGGQGHVYRATDLYLDQEVAVKRLARLGEHESQRLIQEARNLYKVQHPNIVRELGFGIARGTQEPYLVLEFLEGPTLEDWLRLQSGMRMPPEEAVATILPIADAVGCLHRAGIVHRDLKPSNILLATQPDGPPKPCLIDFGGVHVEDVQLTGTGDVVGTVRYMSPEQAESREITPATDVYGLGGVLYRMLTGHPPHEGSNHTECLNKLLRGQIPPPRKRVPGLDRRLEEILLRCLALDPARRYADAGALHAEFQRYRAGEALEVRLPGLLGRLGRAAHRVRQDRGALLLTLAALLMLILALSARLLGRQLDRSAMQAALGEAHVKARERKNALFTAASNCLRDLQRQATRGQLPLDRAPHRNRQAGDDRLAGRLLELLTDWEAFSWISYSSEQGDFIGAYRRPGTSGLGVNKSHRLPGGRTEALDFLVMAGQWQPLKVDPQSAYDPRKRPFYRLAARDSDLHWTAPYVFWEGFPGITCAAAVRDAAGKLRGVLTVDLEVWQLSTALHAGDPERVAVLLTPTGQVVALSRQEVVTRPQQLTRGSGQAARLVTVREIGDPLVQAFGKALGELSPRQLTFAHEDRSYRASVKLSETAGLPLLVCVLIPTDHPDARSPRHRLFEGLAIGGLAAAGLLLLMTLVRLRRV